VTETIQRALGLSADDPAKMPRATARIAGLRREGDRQGVGLPDVLQQAGVPHGKEYRVKAPAGYVLAEAQDDCWAVLSLAGPDPDFIDNEILLADIAAEKLPSGTAGPFRIAAPRARLDARSIRMPARLEAVQVTR
jgi:hypothetical protein